MFSRISLRSGMTALLVVFALALAGAAALGWQAMRAGNRSLQDLHRVGVRQVNAIDNATVALLRAEISVARYVTLKEADRQQEADKSLARARENTELAKRLYAQFRASAQADGTDRALIDALDAGFDKYANQGVPQLFAAAEKWDLPRFKELTSKPLSPSFTPAAQAFFDHANKAGDAAVAAAQSRLAAFQAMCVGGLAVALATIVGARRAMTRLVVGPLEEAGAHCERIARGDLTAAVPPRPTREVAGLFGAIGAMQAGLAGTVGTVREATESITTGTGQIAGGNGDLSARTEQQAASLQQTTASVAELASTVQVNAQSAREASGLAADASQTAQRGGEVVGRAVDTMQRIAANSSRIADITSVIDTIAFQTNILALNAAVEAARAGEQGRGFAVVAGEVRSLAQRSASAAQEIKALIAASGATVQEGEQHVQSAGRTMHEIVEAIGRVAGLVDRIAAASGEQSTGIGQVSEAIAQIDRFTQQNAALVEQAAAAAGSVSGQAQRLRDTVAVFRLG